jgi:hypothetical protein
MRPPFSPKPGRFGLLRAVVAVAASRKGRQILRPKLIRWAAEVAMMFGLLQLMGMFPLPMQQAINGIASGVCLGLGVPLLSKRIWKPSR